MASALPFQQVPNINKSEKKHKRKERNITALFPGWHSIPAQASHQSFKRCEEAPS
jgi:hypothetical protein